MYPVYPFLALNAAIALHLIVAYLGSGNPKEFIGRIPRKLKFAAVGSTLLLAFGMGLLRTAGVVTAYKAPLQIYHDLEKPGVINQNDSVCLGKEWYRFPSSFFLPNGSRARFVKSEFAGLLPGEFAEGGSENGPFPGTWMTPAGMNDRNQEDMSKYVRFDHFLYLLSMNI